MKRTIGFISLAVALLVILFVIFLPTLLSTQLGKDVTLKVVNRQIRGQLSFEKMTISWLGPQEIEGIKLLDPEGNLVFQTDCMQSEESLLYLAFGKSRCGLTTLQKPYLHYVVDQEGYPNLAKALTKEKKKKKRRKSKWECCGAFQIVDGNAVLEKGDKKVTVSNIQMEVDRKTQTLCAQANTETGTSKGQLKIYGKPGRYLDIHVDAKNFPALALDIVKGDTLFSSAFGPEVSLIGELKKEAEGYTVNGIVESQNLKGNLHGSTQGDVLFFDPSSSIHFTVTPQLFRDLVDAEGWSLANRPKINIQIKELKIPLRKENLELKDLDIDADLDLEKTEISHEKLGNFSLRDFQIRINTKKEKEITYSGVIQSRGGSTAISGELDCLGGERYSFCGEAKKFPTVLLEVFFKNGKKIPDLIGPDLDFTFNGTKENNAFLLNYKIVSSRLQSEGKVSGPDYEHLIVTGQGSTCLPDRLTCCLGDHLEFDFSSHLSIEEDHFYISNLSGTLNNPHIKADFHGKLGEEESDFDPHQIEFEIMGTIHDLILIEEKDGFNNGTFNLKIEGPKSLILGKVDLGNTQERGPELHGSLQLENFITENEINLECSRWLMQGNALRFPTEIVGDVLDSELPFCELFGSIINLHFDVGYLPGRHALIEVEAKGDGFQADLSFCLNETFHVSETKPSCIHWEITPTRYQTLLGLWELVNKSRFVLNQTATIDLNIKELTCPNPPPSNLSGFLCQSGFVGDFKINGLVLKAPRNADWLAIPKIEGVLNGQDFSKDIHLNLRGNIEAGSIPRGQRSDFEFKGEVLDFFLESGKINRERMRIKGEMAFDYVPVKEMLCWLPIREELSTSIFALLGTLVNGRIYGDISSLSGPLTVDVKSTNFKALLPLQLQNGVVYLKQAVEAELTLTPEVSDTFLKDINPLFLTGAWSDHPVKLYIDASGFMMPLRPFSIQTTHIDRAVIDLGRVYVRNGGQVSTLMNFLKARDISPDGVMEAWFTPIYMNLHQGIASYNRFDLLLAGQVHLAFWGSINLMNEQVDMRLAISEQTLNQRFNIAGIKKTDMFQVKMTGSTSNLQIDWSGATTRIGILIAKSTAGGLGKIVGGLLEQIVKTMGEEPTPPPTVFPFPWEQTYPQAEKNEDFHPPFNIAITP